jgi:RNA polymerase sigma-70 factor (ECF subfamily)
MSTKTPAHHFSKTPHVTEIMVAHYPELVRFLERRVGRRDVAEDILQETIAANLERLAELRDPGAALGWLYRTLRNAASDHHRRTKLVERVHDRIGRETEAVQAPAEAVLSNPCMCPTRIADELKPEYADALRSIEIEGASLQSYAEQRSISSGNAGVRVFVHARRSDARLPSCVVATRPMDAPHARVERTRAPGGDPSRRRATATRSILTCRACASAQPR